MWHGQTAIVVVRDERISGIFRNVALNFSEYQLHTKQEVSLEIHFSLGISL